MGSSYSKPVRQFQFAIVHDSAYQKLIELYEGQEPWGRMPRDRKAFVTYAAGPQGSRTSSSILDSMRCGGCNWAYQLSHDTLLPGIEAYADGSLNADGLYEKVKPWIDFRYFMAGLEMLNLKFSPLVYASQDYGNEVGEMYAKFVSEVSAEVCTERRKDDEVEEVD